MEFKFRPGSRIKKLTANIVGNELEKIRKKTGELTPKNVVNAARPVKAPLHPEFTWDDQKCGDLWREHEARNLIRAIEVIKEDSQEPAPMYVHIDTEPKRYEAVSVVVQRPDLFAAAISELNKHMQGAISAVKQLESAAKGSEDRDKLLRVAMAVKAIETAADAIKALH